MADDGGGRMLGGIGLGGVLVIVGIVLAIVWSLWIGIIIALIGLIAFGGFVRGKWLLTALQGFERMNTFLSVAAKRIAYMAGETTICEGRRMMRGDRLGSNLLADSGG